MTTESCAVTGCATVFVGVFAISLLIATREWAWLIIGVIIAAVWMLWRHTTIRDAQVRESVQSMQAANTRPRTSAPPRAESAEWDTPSWADPGKRQRVVARDYEPSKPDGEAFDPWGTEATAAETVGEAFRERSIRRLLPSMDRLPEGDWLLRRTTALLADDSANPHDRNAVAVWIGGEHVAYLDRVTAQHWSKTVRELAAKGQVLRVRARMWASERDKGGLFARVTIWLPDLDTILPVNNLPEEPHVILPTGSRMQVTKEEEHMDVLAPIVRPGVRTPIAVTLHAIKEVRPRSVIDAVEVRIDGERVGILTPAMSSHMLPLVRHVEARGKVAVARASVSGSRIKAEVELNVARASEVDDAWLDSIGPIAPVVVEHKSARPDYEWGD